MKLLKIMMLFVVGALMGISAFGQANASLNILSLNSGQVYLGGTVDIQVSVGNTGPGNIGVNKVRAQINVPIAIVSILSTAQQTGLPPGWVITANTTGSITVCNGTDPIAAGEQRQVFIKIQGNAIGGPSTINGSLSFGPGTGVCTGLGSLPGDNTADNTSTTSIQVIAAPACTLAVTASAGTIACNGGTTTLTATPTGAIGAIEYSLTGGAPFQSSANFTVSAGTYTVTAREVNLTSCVATAAAVTVASPPIVTAPVIGTITQPNCALATGSVDLGGLPPGNWTINPGSITGNTSTTTISGLTPGTYSFTVTNSSGCASTASGNVVIDAQSIPVAPTVSVVQPTCTVATGTITITSATTGLTYSLDGGAYAAYPAGGYTVAAGAHTLTAQNTSGCNSTVTNITVDAQPVTPTAPVTGTIVQPTCAVSTASLEFSGLPAGNWTINPGTISGNGATTTINGLVPGTYNFTVTNAAGCTSPASANVVIDNVVGAPATPVVNIIQPTCTLATGTITVTSATTGLTFSIDGGAYATYPASGYIVATGSHTLIAQNAGSCLSPVATIIVNAQPATPVAPTVSVVQPTCSVATGTITVTSATTGLTFNLDGGAFAAYPAAGYTAGAGNHTIRAQNASGCISTVANAVVNIQPATPAVSVSAGAITCFGGNTTLTATASGGTAPFQYSVNGGAFQSANTFTVNAAGSPYAITVRDANLCTATAAAITVNQPAAITAAASIGTIGCFGGTSTLIVTTTGGAGALEYSLNGGAYQPGNSFTVGAGTYTVMVRAVVNPSCTATTAPVTITQPTALTVSATASRITQCGGTTVVTITAFGGVTPYSSGIGSFTRGPGTWNFSVTDAGGCTAVKTITIEAPGCMVLKAYPNPAGNTLNINHSVAEAGATMKVFAINGTLVITKPVAQDAFQTTVDVSKLPSGSYVLVYWNGVDKKEILFEKIVSH